MFNRSGLEEKQIYANILRQTHFNLCPRGCVLAGVGSRLYETMQAARVPVIISDQIVLPAGIEWDLCSVRIKERDISRIAQILSRYDQAWMEMAENAHRAYEQHFSSEVLLDEIGSCLRELLACYESNVPGSIVSRVSSRARIALGFLLIRLMGSFSGISRLKRRLTRA